MLSVLQRSNALVRRCARYPSYANITHWPRRQQKLSRNSFQTYHYSLSAPIPRKHHVWTKDETRKLVEHVRSVYYSRKRFPNWKRIGEHLGIPPMSCKNIYFLSRNIDFTKEDAEAAKNSAEDSKFTVKTVSYGDNKRASSQVRWTTDDIARLREARGDRNKKPVKGSWPRIAEYVGAGKTAAHCIQKWQYLCRADDLKALGDNPINTTAANGPTYKVANYHVGWTPDEMLQLKALFDTPYDRRNPRTRIAYALFPQKPRAQVRYTMSYLYVLMCIRRRNTKALESRPLLRKLVSDSGGAEKADWEAISKEIGLTAILCQKTYHKMTVAKSNDKLWSPDEYDRLLTNLRSQNTHSDAYDWDLAAAAVVTRSKRECYLRFVDDKRSNRLHLYDSDSLQE